ncbi:hypothetical protein [Glycomyces artemisiae]|uniref:Tetratricopeptide repeat protein n=1 Tax=Glycomyces artemisiae TaxID=1076443 RepID=A0A2T0UH25_9ACTN|nr:hypothetical protein [Glycomyces artemisiae]PRY57253.1 hypothetical protein B0I28_107101 [Glycomyces artemisiae]
MTALLGADGDGSHVRVVIRDRLGYLAEGLGEARAHREAGYRAALETGHTPLIALSLIGIADLALRRGDDGAAARMLAASDALDGLPDYHSHPDVAASRRAARTRLGETRFAEATAAGRLEDWREAAEAVLALLAEASSRIGQGGGRRGSEGVTLVRATPWMSCLTW